MERYICIHGHFYQPPRENAWLEYLETQDSAYPHHDWNERVAAECYAPNTAARLLDKDGYVTEFVNNYGQISFNFGPTLLKWLEENAPPVYQAVIASDRDSRSRFSGHGSALAQPYHHIIMPLANRRDKETQVQWGIYDFERRFGRKPEGMWLPETAVDLVTLDIMAASGIKFSILAPHQAKRTRAIGENAWNELSDAAIDPTVPYELRLPSGRKLSLFFYNGAIANEVAFSGLLANGEDFARRLTGAFPEDRNQAALVHIANDGETYGHHHQFGEMALAFALRYIESHNLAKITNYGEFLEKYPPAHEVEIHENTSWTCRHGIERWRSDDGCNAGRNPRWRQMWRAPLREAMDWLRDRLAPQYEAAAGELLRDPLAARNEYIELILDRSPENVSRFFAKHQARVLREDEIVRALKLLEMARHTLLMYTSDGWYFDELSGVETVQVIQYAARAVELAEELFGGIEEDFLEHLERAESNIPEFGDGRRIYQQMVLPYAVTLTKMAAHFSVSSVFQDYGRQSQVYCYQVTLDDQKSLESGASRLTIGRGKISSTITRETAGFSFGALRTSSDDVVAGISDYESGASQVSTKLASAFSSADLKPVVELLEKHFTARCSIEDLLPDDGRKVLEGILDSALGRVQNAYHRVYEHCYRPIQAMADAAPRSHNILAEYLLNGELRQSLTGAYPAPCRRNQELAGRDGQRRLKPPFSGKLGGDDGKTRGVTRRRGAGRGTGDGTQGDGDLTLSHRPADGAEPLSPVAQVPGARQPGQGR